MFLFTISVIIDNISDAEYFTLSDMLFRAIFNNEILNLNVKSSPILNINVFLFFMNFQFKQTSSLVFICFLQFI